MFDSFQLCINVTLLRQLFWIVSDVWAHSELLSFAEWCEWYISALVSFLLLKILLCWMGILKFRMQIQNCTFQNSMIFTRFQAIYAVNSRGILHTLLVCRLFMLTFCSSTIAVKFVGFFTVVNDDPTAIFW